MLLAIYLGVGALAAACNGGTATANCDGDNCEMVGTTQICTQCKQNFVPVNGQCTAKEGAKTKCADATGATATDQTCKKCLSTTFMYKGGCYEATATLGSAMCTKAAAGLCTAPASGYFVPTGVVNTEQFVVACDDTTGVTIAAIGGKYKGVQNCMTCVTSDAAPGARADTVTTCTRCKDQQYLKDNACVADANQCTTGYTAKQDDTNGNRCLACTDQSNGGAANCAECTYDSAKTRLKCMKCKDPNYLKTAADGTTTCVDQDKCVTDSFPVMNAQTGNKCVSCGDTDAGVPNCAKCTAPASTGQKLTCSDCGSGYKLEGEACVSTSVDLSMGAIAGISVAAVVVVGGLVGFLCW